MRLKFWDVVFMFLLTVFGLLMVLEALHEFARGFGW